MIIGPRRGPFLRIFFEVLVVASIALAASTSHAAVATGSLSVSAVVINQCVISSSAVVESDRVRCSGNLSAYKIVENTTEASGSIGSRFTTVYF